MSQQYESAPQAPPEPAYNAGGASGPRAGFWRRFAAAFIDGLLINAVAYALGQISPILNILGLVGSIAYYVILEGGPTGQTLGKKALGIRVYDLAQGGPIGYGRAFIRWIGRIASTIPIFLGYFWMLWDSEKQTWHDKLAGSVVVPADAYR
jgi:uncharacterized RDD family membrane protein YckC